MGVYMAPGFIKFLNIGFIGPLLLRVSEGKKLTSTQRNILKLVGLATIGYNSYYFYKLYKSGKEITVDTLTSSQG